ALLGFLIGSAFRSGIGGVVGAAAAGAVWLVQLGVALRAGDRALLAGARARPIVKEDLPLLWNVVEEMTIAAGLPAMPQIRVIDDDAPNAFAAGTAPERSAIAVTSGLLKRLNRDELQGVVAHEIGHLRNLDSRFLTIAVVLVASVTIVSDLVLRGMRAGVRVRRAPRIGGPAQL